MQNLKNVEKILKVEFIYFCSLAESKDHICYFMYLIKKNDYIFKIYYKEAFLLLQTKFSVRIVDNKKVEYKIKPWNTK